MSSGKAYDESFWIMSGNQIKALHVCTAASYVSIDIMYYFLINIFYKNKKSKLDFENHTPLS